MINLDDLAVDVRHTVIDSVADLAEGHWAAGAAGAGRTALDQGAEVDLIHDKIVTGQPLDVYEVQIVEDALLASEHNCRELADAEPGDPERSLLLAADEYECARLDVLALFTAKHSG